MEDFAILLGCVLVLVMIVFFLLPFEIRDKIIEWMIGAFSVIASLAIWVILLLLAGAREERTTFSDFLAFVSVAFFSSVIFFITVLVGWVCLADVFNIKEGFTWWKYPVFASLAMFFSAVMVKIIGTVRNSRRYV